MDREKLKSIFEKKSFTVSFYDTGEDCKKALCDMIPKDKSIAFGGSKTLEAIGLKEALEQKGVRVIWHWDKTQKNALKDARLADYYASSANGVSETGEIVNIDGNGNRLSALCYGHEKVFLVIGKNKLEKDLHSAIARAKFIAAVKNGERFGIKSDPEEKPEERFKKVEKLCRITQILEYAPSMQKTHLMFVDEELGF